MKEEEKKEPKKTSFLEAVREFFHGMVAHEAVVAKHKGGYRESAVFGYLQGHDMRPGYA